MRVQQLKADNNQFKNVEAFLPKYASGDRQFCHAELRLANLTRTKKDKQAIAIHQ